VDGVSGQCSVALGALCRVVGGGRSSLGAHGSLHGVARVGPGSSQVVPHGVQLTSQRVAVRRHGT